MTDSTFDLDKLERLEREATPGPWNLKGRGIGYNIFATRVIDFSGGLESVHGLSLCRISELSRDGESDLDLLIALRNAAPALFAELRTLRARVAELERDARLGQAVREAAEQTGDITDVEVLRDDDLCRGVYIGTIVVTEHQFDVLCAIDSALREEEGEERNR